MSSKFVLSISLLLSALSSLNAQSPSVTPQASSAATVTPAAASGRYAPHRVYDTRRRRFIDLETLISRIAKDADVAFLGEFHNDPGTHVLQAAILEGVQRRREGAVVLALEMFERDVQTMLNEYLGGSLSEEEFLAKSRPWPNYRSDYRPMVEFAKAQGWPVVAGNVPRRLAQVVSRRGLVALDSIPEGDKPFIAREHVCSRNAYWERFRETMGDMSGHGMQMTPDQLEAMVWRTYEAQCVKDEAMAESIVAARAAHNTLVIHANGAFHSDYRLGTAERVKRRDPRARQIVVSFAPERDLDAVNGRERRKLGDYVVFTLAPEPAPANR
jgi:uncharacterized iron-regulated protein